MDAGTPGEDGLQMTPEERIRKLEAEVERLREKEKILIHDTQIYKQVFNHLVKQFEDLKRQLGKR